MALISWIVFGLVAGAVARFIMPGRQRMGVLMTILLGVAGSFTGGFVASLVSGSGVTEFQPSSFLWSVGGAPVTQEYCDTVGADGFAPDASSTVRLTKKLMGLGEKA